MNKKYERIIATADLFIERRSTVRDIARIQGRSKSIVHLYLTKELKKVCKIRYNKVMEIINHNLADRHNRGGEATKIKYEKLRGL